MVRIVKIEAASPTDKPKLKVPMIMPPTRLITMISKPATASPLTNFEAPSIEP